MKQQLVESNKPVTKHRRESKGRVLAISRRIYRLQNDVFYVESESSNNTYYFVKYKPDVLEWWCSCIDNSTRHKKCKHIYGVEFAIRMGTLKDTNKLPADAKRDTKIAVDNKPSYEDDDYSF